MKSKGKRSGFCPTTTYGNRPISTAMARDAQNLHFCRPPPIVASAQPQIGPESHFLLHTLSFVHKEEANQSGSVCRVAPRSQLVTAWSTTMGKAPTTIPTSDPEFPPLPPPSSTFPMHPHTNKTKTCTMNTVGPAGRRFFDVFLLSKRKSPGVRGDGFAEPATTAEPPQRKGRIVMPPHSFHFSPPVVQDSLLSFDTSVFGKVVHEHGMLPNNKPTPVPTSQTAPPLAITANSHHNTNGFAFDWVDDESLGAANNGEGEIAFLSHHTPLSPATHEFTWSWDIWDAIPTQVAKGEIPDNGEECICFGERVLYPLMSNGEQEAVSAVSPSPTNCPTKFHMPKTTFWHEHHLENHLDSPGTHQLLSARSLKFLHYFLADKPPDETQSSAFGPFARPILHLLGWQVQDGPPHLPKGRPPDVMSSFGIYVATVHVSCSSAFPLLMVHKFGLCAFCEQVFGKLERSVSRHTKVSRRA